MQLLSLETAISNLLYKILAAVSFYLPLLFVFLLSFIDSNINLGKCLATKIKIKHQNQDQRAELMGVLVASCTCMFAEKLCWEFIAIYD